MARFVEVYATLDEHRVPAEMFRSNTPGERVDMLALLMHLQAARSVRLIDCPDDDEHVRVFKALILTIFRLAEDPQFLVDCAGLPRTATPFAIIAMPILDDRDHATMKMVIDALVTLGTRHEHGDVRELLSVETRQSRATALAFAQFRLVCDVMPLIASSDPSLAMAARALVGLLAHIALDKDLMRAIFELSIKRDEVDHYFDKKDLEAQAFTKTQAEAGR